MKQLFYFAFADVMALVEYDREENMLTYSTSRRMAFAERATIEMYLLQVVAPKLGFYTPELSAFFYIGPEKCLERELENFKYGVAVQRIRANEADINAAIKVAIDAANAGSLLPIRLESMKK